MVHNRFYFVSQLGFRLEENITVYGISSEMLRTNCLEAIHWGDSFWFLSRLVMPDPQTSKLRQNGLIFKVYMFFTINNVMCIIYSYCISYDCIGNVRQCERITSVLSLGVTKNHQST